MPRKRCGVGSNAGCAAAIAINSDEPPDGCAVTVPVLLAGQPELRKKLRLKKYEAISPSTI